MSILSICLTIFGGIVVIGAVITIVILINNRLKRVATEYLSDEGTQLSIEEQYLQTYGDE